MYKQTDRQTNRQTNGLTNILSKNEVFESNNAKKQKKGPVVKYYKELHFFYHKIHLFVLKLENEILTALHCMDTDSLENDFW